jgi:putative ABC transport system substrate-binding protein
MKRRALIASVVAGSLFGTRFALAGNASQRLGIFIAGSCNAETRREFAPMFKILAELGHVEGRNLTVEWRCFDMDFSRSAQMAAELVRLNPDVIWTAGTPQTRALQAATRTIPIVTSVGDLVGSGFAKSYARPGGNITGVSEMHPDTPAKQVELMRRIVPGLDRMVFIDDIRYSGARELMRVYEIAAKAAGLASEVRIINRSEIERVFIDMKRSGTAAALLTFADPDLAEFARLALRHRIPTMFHDSEYVEKGGLASFGMYHEDEMRRHAVMIDKILRGMNPAEIPTELPDRSQLAVNLSTAKVLGLTIPPDILLRADEIIQ